MATEWFYKAGGVECGPLNQAQLVEMVIQGRIGRETLLRNGTAGRWVLAGNVRGLSFPDGDSGPSATLVSKPGYSTSASAAHAPLPVAHQTSEEWRDNPAPVEPARTLESLGGAHSSLQPVSISSLPKRNPPVLWRWLGIVRQKGKAVVQVIRGKAGPLALSAAQEVRATALETWMQTMRLWDYGKANLRRRRANREFIDARIALGRKLFQGGAGDQQLLKQLTDLSEKKKSLEAAQASKKAVVIEEKGLMIRLADQSLGGQFDLQSAGMGDERRKAMESKNGLDESIHTFAKSRSALFPSRTVDRVRVVSGYGLLFCVIAFGFFGFRTAAKKADVGEQSAKPILKRLLAGELWQQGDASATGIDPVLERVLGPVSSVYKENGFKGRVLGTTMAEIERNTPLDWTSPSNPASFLNKASKHDEQFIFDSEKQLVQYTKIYEGGAQEYVNQLVEVFGKTDERNIRRWTSSFDFGRSANAVTSTFYHFPKIFAEIIFETTIKEYGPGAVGQKEKTFVVILSKPWAMKVLNEDVEHKRANLTWLQHVAVSTSSGEIDPTKWPSLDGAALRDDTSPLGRRNGGKMLVDAKYLKTFGNRAPSFFSTYTRRDERTDRSMTVLNFNFTFYSKNATAQFFNMARFDRLNGNNALIATSFAQELLEEMNSQLGQEYFPPKDDLLNIVTPKDGRPYHEWRTVEGWRVTTGTHGLTIEISEKKSL